MLCPNISPTPPLLVLLGSFFFPQSAPHSGIDVAVAALLGCACGLAGVLFIGCVSLCLRIRDWAHSSGKLAPLLCLVSAPPMLIALAGLSGVFLLRVDADVLVEIDQYIFQAEPVGLAPPLLLYTPLKLVFTAMSISLPVPAGLFTPVFVTGGAVGRLFGELVHHFSATVTTLVPWEFALIGATAMVSGVTRTISTAVIVLEMTGHHELALPMGIAVIAAYFTCNAFVVNIFDFLVADRAVPHVPKFPTAVHDVLASAVMLKAEDMPLLTVDATVADARRCLAADSDGDIPFAVVRSRMDLTFMGTVSRQALARAVPTLPRFTTVAGISGPANPLLERRKAQQQQYGTVGQEQLAGGAAPGIRFEVETAPFLMSDCVPLRQLEVTFCMLKLNHTMLTRHGQLTGVISRAQLMRYFDK